MKKILTLLALIVATNANAQLISWFTWENSPLTTAAAGANGISVSAYATATTGKTGKGLNPGSGSNDINLVLDGANFNVPALDVSLDFRREETQASFLYRGSYFNFGMSGCNLSASFLLTNGTSYKTVTSGNVYAVPDDHSFHTYRFSYENNTGIAKIWVDGNAVYTYTGTAGVPMYWTGAGNVTIGKDSDATGKNVAIFDNMVIQIHANALLPLTLLSFAADVKNNKTVLNWSTTQEFSVASFVIEQSTNGINYNTIGMLPAVNQYNTVNRYQFADSAYSGGRAYYRIKMLNNDGGYSYSSVATVNSAITASLSMSVYPNPASNFAVIKMNNAKAGLYYYTVTSLTGSTLMVAPVQINEGRNLVNVDLSGIKVKGALIISLLDAQHNSAATFTVIKN